MEGYEARERLSVIFRLLAVWGGEDFLNVSLLGKVQILQPEQQKA